MPTLLDDLQNALGGSYRLLRELGGGGMSRVYLAEETALGRQVVIKVLPPELAAGINVERFRREIQLAAKLQHPHVVPLLAAGRAGELLFYTMPFIEGESLRAKLTREGELPVVDAVRLLRDVVDALAYAHEQGVLHRDIKPDNVLVSRNHGLVTDFGVAKALSEAAAGQGAPTGFTSAGVAMGTPTYMAPEQATADPTIDHRADIYSVGIMAYEMLAGHPPFAGRTPQQLLAAHVNRPPEPLGTVRSSIPPDLAAVVMRCLEKRPADRWQGADELLRALEAVATPGTGTASTVATPAARPAAAPPAQGRKGFRAALGAAAMIAGLGAGALFLRVAGILPGRSLVERGVLKDREPILVAEFRSPPADSALGGAVTEAFRIDLAQSPKVTVVQPEYVQQVLARMQRDPRARLEPDLAREVAIRDGIKAFVAGEVVHAGTAFVISARLIATRSGDALVALRENAADSTRILAAIDRLSRGMRERIGGSLGTVQAGERLEDVTTPSLEALRKYSLALGANREGDTERSIALLRDAVELDTGFAMAYRKLGVVISNTGGRRSEQVRAFTEAYDHRDRLTDRERYLTQAAYETYVTGDQDRAITAYRSLLDLYPNDPYALNNLSIALMELRDYRQAADLSRRAIVASPDDATFYLNLIGAQVGLGQADSAEATLRLMRSKTRGDPYVSMVDVAFLSARGEYDSAAAVVRRVQDARRDSPNWRTMTSAALATLATTQGRLAQADGYLQAAVLGSEAENLPERALLYEVGRAGLDLWYRGQPERARRKADAALQRWPLERLNPADRPYLELAVFWAEAGRPDRARTLVADYDRLVPQGMKRAAATLRHAALGSIALAERRPDAAAAEFRLQDQGDCEVCALGDLGRAYDNAGQADSAIAVYERYTGKPYVYRMFSDAIWLGRTYYRLGELYEERGEPAKAAENYAKLVQLWQDADPELRTKVLDAKARLKALAGEHAAT
ncbi:MAG: protein kinase domain-containing protein [Gemmatimonadota bacterium]|jgi:tetratricopeptide (TPR) repeat protein/tRNA A-37 threonylcarbamoyl transferase component Bud32